MKIPPPLHLSTAAAESWSEITASLTEEAGGESAALEAYATALARLRDAQSRIDREGSLIADAKGNPIQHPALAIEKSAAAEIRLWAVHFRRYGTRTSGGLGAGGTIGIG